MSENNGLRKPRRIYLLKPYRLHRPLADIVVVDGPCVVSTVRGSDGKTRVCIEAEPSVHFTKMSNMPADRRNQSNSTE